MTEVNPFRYFLPANATKLILGSFPCFNGKDYGDWYYSGSGKNHFWKLLSLTLEMPGETRTQKMALCKKHGIALSDIAYKIERNKGNCSDANLKILEYNVSGIKKCLDAGIKEIYFTSRFVEKHFLRMFERTDLKGNLLVSPSPAANMHIGGLEEYIELKKTKKVNNPFEYRLLKYQILKVK